MALITAPLAPNHTGVARRLAHRAGGFICLLLLASLPPLTATAQAPAEDKPALLRCQIEQGGDTFHLEARPVQNPYREPMHDINEHFRFKMVVVGSAKSVDYVKIYAYENPSRQPVLLQYAKYLKPAFAGGSDSAALTGIQTVYSSGLEREMQYRCALYEHAP